MKKNPKSKRADAEKAAVHYAYEIENCIMHHKAVRTQWQSVDFFGADVMGKRKDGSCVYLQATAGQYSAVSARRKKLEKVPWLSTDTVRVLQLINTIDPANARKKLWFFRVHELCCTSPYDGAHDPRVWEINEKAVSIPKEWFKARK